MWQHNIICQVLVEYKSKDLVYAVLNKFISNYKTINLDYTRKPDDEDYNFQSEDEMISYFMDTPNVIKTFYWNKYENNPDKIMVGVNITNDNQTIFSLTVGGTKETEATYYSELPPLSQVLAKQTCDTSCIKSSDLSTKQRYTITPALSDSPNEGKPDK